MEEIDFLNGFLSIIVVGISFYVGIHILSKFLKYKRKEFILVGLVAIITSEPWWPHVISFFLAIFQLGRLSDTSYFLFGTVLIPVAIVFWLMALGYLLWSDDQKKRKIVNIFSVIYLMIYEVILFTFLFFINPEIIGRTIGQVDVQYHPLMISLLISALAIILPTGLLFARESLRSSDPEILMKGRFLILAFITYCIGASIDVLFLSSSLNLIVARILLVIASFGFLGGFIPPSWIKQIFLSREYQEKK